MKPLLIAAALLLLPAAAQAQVAAGTMPTVSTTRPARRAAPAPAPVAAPANPANARSEDVLREIIAGAQAGTINYALMTDDLAARIRTQEAAIRPLIEGFGPVQAVDFVGSPGRRRPVRRDLLQRRHPVGDRLQRNRQGRRPAVPARGIGRQSSEPGRPRPLLMVERLALPSSRRSFEARVGLVGTR
jgi:hypothetical protein